MGGRLAVDVVEIDPAIVKIARRYFGFVAREPGAGPILTDARNPLDLWLRGSTVAWHRNLRDNFGTGFLLTDAR